MNYSRLKEMIQAEDPKVWETILAVLQYEESKMHQSRPNYKKELRNILEEKAHDYQRNHV